MMNGKRKREVVVITGASAGLGRAIVKEFAKRGACIGLLARGHAGLEGARREAEALGGQAIAVPTDVSDPEAVERAASLVEETFGPIDIWINDAMTSVFAPVHEMTAADYKRVTEVTYLGYVYGTMAALKRMRPRDRGMIVLVGSALAYRAIPLQSAYCACKHAIQGFSESLRSELIHYGSKVKVTMIQMPAMNTPQFDWSKSRMPRKPQPVPPIYQPEAAAAAVYYAAHHYRREWDFGGSTDIVIWGNKIAPGLGDWYLAESGFSSQMTAEPDDPHRPNNLYEPVDQERDHGARGRFDRRSTNSSFQWWLSKNRGWMALAGLAALGAWGVASQSGPKAPQRRRATVFSS
jgi:NAD(P)-dependent dehydrogenase (short-subunit alcohol dehydrogenase family)